MTPMRFFILNGLVLLLVVLYILRKRPKSQFRLRLRRLGGALSPDVKPADARSGAGVGAAGGVGMGMAADGRPYEKMLNTLFNYNGHTWDAYEVLGLPAGSPQHKIDEAYKLSVSKQQGESSRDFLDAAYRAIRAQKSKN